MACLTLAVILANGGCSGPIKDQTIHKFADAELCDFLTRHWKTLPSERAAIAKEIAKRKIICLGSVAYTAKSFGKKKKKKSSSAPNSESSGSGFLISKLGHVVTNNHVVAGCKRVLVGDNPNQLVATSVLETDSSNDLALLRINATELSAANSEGLIRKLGPNNAPLSSISLLRLKNVELGEEILVAGYPYGEIFSNTIKVTKGIVSAIRGIGDDSSQFQVDAAVQPGNSGGPIYDKNGNVVGVVVAQLNKLKIAKATGSLPENVNFGIKGSTVRQFLNSAGLPTKSHERLETLSNRDLAKIAKSQTLIVICKR